MSLLPVTLLTGFLGSGKSTLLTQILKDSAFGNCAVIVNEFGDIGLDDILVTHSEEQTMEMTTGCLCCTIRGDITETLLDLFQRREHKEIPAFQRVIIETTGMADPAPILHTLISEPRIASRFKLGGIITTVDFANGLATLDKFEESRKQVAVADRLVFTKTDLDIDPAAAHDLHQKINQLAPHAQKQDKNDPAFQLDQLFDTNLFKEGSDTPDVENWLNIQDTQHGHSHDHGHHHHHDHGSDEIKTFVLEFDKPLSTNAFIMAMQLLISNQGKDLLRIKGIVSFIEKPDQPVILHGVQHVFHEPLELDQWPDGPKKSRLVFITRNIDKTTIETFFKAWAEIGDEEALAALQ